jgi:ankyrin repeat protein
MKEVTASKNELCEVKEAIQKKDISLITQLVKENPAVLTQKLENERNIWHLIADEFCDRHVEAVKALAEHARNCFKNTQEGYASFFIAQDQEGNSALHIATKRNEIYLVKLLISVYEELIADELKENALPAQHAKQKVAAYINLRNSQGRTIMHDVVPKSHNVDWFLSEVKYFISKGARVDIADNDGVKTYDHFESFLKFAYAKGRFLYALTIFYYAMIYVKNGADPDHKNLEGESLIEIIERYSIGWTEQHTADLRSLYRTYLQKGQDERTVSNDIEECQSSISLLTAKYSSVEATREEEFYALLAAVEENDHTKAKQLVENNPAILTKRTTEGHNFWHVIGISISQLGCPTIKIIAECAYDYLKDTVEGYDSFFLARDKNGNTALHLAMKARQETIVDYLISSYKHTLEVKGLPLALIQQKVAAFINMRDLNGRTIMHYIKSVDCINYFSVKEYASRGADVSIADKGGNRPYDAFSDFVKKAYNPKAYKVYNFVRIYVMYGADPDQSNQEGETINSLAQNYVKDWTKADTESLKIAYLISLKRKARREWGNNAKVLEHSITHALPDQEAKPKAISYIDEEILTQEEVTKYLNSDLEIVSQWLADEPAVLTKRTNYGDNLWQISASWFSEPNFDRNKIKAVAFSALKYLKNQPGGYDNYFLARCTLLQSTALLSSIRCDRYECSVFLLSVYEEVLKADGLPPDIIKEKLATLINMGDNVGLSVMHSLTFTSKKVLDTVKFLISKGGSIKLIAHSGWLPHKYWCSHLKGSYEDGKAIAAALAFQFARLYVENGIDPDQPAHSKETIISIVERYSNGWKEQQTNKLRQIYQRYLKKASVIRNNDQHNPTSISKSDLSLSLSIPLSSLSLKFSGNKHPESAIR